MNKDEIKKYLELYKITNYSINKDLTIDVFKSVDFSFYELEDITVQFNEVHGNFFIKGCDLNSLKGCPKIVRGDFDMSYNSLTSLEFGPEIVGGSFYDTNTKLESLKGLPREIAGDLHLEQSLKDFARFHKYKHSLTVVKPIMGDIENNENQDVQNSRFSIEELKNIRIHGDVYLPSFYENDPIYQAYILKQKIKELT